MKISALIAQLQRAQKELGNVETFVSQDEEGNAYFKIDEVAVDEGCVVIFPSHEITKSLF